MCVVLAVWSCAPASATEYVDGVSDLNIATWDSNTEGYFTKLFTTRWVAGGHIKYLRYVVQWNAMIGTSKFDKEQRTQFEAWYNDVESRMSGLTLDLSLTTYEATERERPTAATYKEALQGLLSYATAVRYVEPWNEPDSGGQENGKWDGTYVTPSRAAEYAKEASTLCNVHGCGTVVGNLLDCEECQMVKYEKEYVAALGGWTFRDWGMHPYLAVKNRAIATVTEFKEHWGDGASSLWFTEVGAYECEDYGSTEIWTEAEQGEHAEWLVKTLIPETGPEHVFYYFFLEGYGEQPQKECEEKKGKPDTALYVPSGDPNAPDRPRPAAAWIFGNTGESWGYTGGASPCVQEISFLDWQCQWE